MISIIIPTLNEENYLGILLDSIKKQQYKDYEIIVADAGSEDKTIKIAERYGCTVVKGGLPGKARNNGAKAAKGDVLLFLDADIVIKSPEFLGNSLNEFKRNNLGSVTFFLLPQSSRISDKIAYLIWNKWIVLLKRFFPHGAAAFMVKKEVHQSVNGFDESVVFAEDQAYVASISKVANFNVIMSDPLLISPRRFDRDGRFITYLKYILADLHILFLGPVRSGIFNYKFNHYRKEKIKR